MRYIMSFMGKEINPRIEGFYLHYNDDHKHIDISEIYDKSELKNRKLSKIPHAGFPFGQIYYWIIEIQHIEEGQDLPYQTAFIPIDKFEEWVKKPYKHKELREIYSRFVDAVQKKFDWIPKIEFIDV